MSAQTIPRLALCAALASCGDASAPASEASTASSAATTRRVHVTAMAPLEIGRLDAPRDSGRESDWARFAADVRAAKELGVEAISFDLWWGSVDARLRREVRTLRRSATP